MNKFETEQALMRLGEQMTAWRKARTASLKARDRVLRLLLHHAAVNRMTVSEVAKHTGFTRKQIRTYMTKFNLDWHQPKTLLAERAGKALRQNAEIMGLTPAEMDLTSPLAYLPMGDKMVREFLETQVAPVVVNEYDQALEDRLYEEIVSDYEGRGEAWTTTYSGDTLARAAAVVAMRVIGKGA